MSLNVNTVILAGNLTRDPEMRSLANERAVANFGLAINRRWKSPDGEVKEDVTFVDVEAWGRTAELVGQYLTKGSGCYIEGRLKLDTWTDQASGQKRSRMKVVAESVQFVGNRRREGESAEEPAMAGGVPAAAPAAASAPARGRGRVAEPPNAAAMAVDEPPF